MVLTSKDGHLTTSFFFIIHNTVYNVNQNKNKILIEEAEIDNCHKFICCSDVLHKVCGFETGDNEFPCFCKVRYGKI